MKEIKLLPQEKFWYRRGLFKYQYPFSQNEVNIPKAITFLDKEWSFINEFLFEHFDFTGSYIEEDHNNKIKNLIAAKESGFAIPATIITTQKEEAISFLKKYGKVITKPIHNAHIDFEFGDKKMVSTGTQLVDQNDFELLENQFSPVLLQEYIEKEIEIRIFFFHEQLYSMAIFSQRDEKTKIDYRNYNREKPNRNVPFSLPKRIKSNLEDFIASMKLNTGSIDLILSREGSFVFLEVNPTGQFGWLSSECNYYAEEEIAKYLIEKYEK